MWKREKAKPQTFQSLWDAYLKAKNIAEYADGIVIGSALIKQIEKSVSNRNAINNVLGLVKKYSSVIKKARIT